MDIMRGECEYYKYKTRSEFSTDPNLNFVLKMPRCVLRKVENTQISDTGVLTDFYDISRGTHL